MIPLFNPQGPEVYYPGMPCNPRIPSAAEILKKEIDDLRRQMDSLSEPHVSVATKDALPEEGSSGTVYITTDDLKVYRWTGSAYEVISDINSLNAHLKDDTRHVTGDERTKWNLGFAHISRTDNPHGVTAAQTGSVPTSRKVNGKALSADITLGAGDVGAYTKAQVDAAAKATLDKMMTGDLYVKSRIVDGVQHYVKQVMAYDNDMNAWGAEWTGDYVYENGEYKEVK